MISGTLERGAKIERISQQFNVSVETLSALNGVLATTGASVDDLNFSFASISKHLNKAFSPEQKKNLQDMGINLDEIRKSGDPMMAMFLAVSDVLKRFPIGSAEATKALELLGISASSNLIPILQKGGEELQRLMGRTVETGGTFDKEFTRMAKNSCHFPSPS